MDESVISGQKKVYCTPACAKNASQRRNRLRKVCSRKVSYQRRHQALLVMKIMARRGVSLIEYECRACGKYHLATRKSAPRQVSPQNEM